MEQKLKKYDLVRMHDERCYMVFTEIPLLDIRLYGCLIDIGTGEAMPFNPLAAKIVGRVTRYNGEHENIRRVLHEIS